MLGYRTRLFSTAFSATLFAASIFSLTGGALTATASAQESRSTAHEFITETRQLTFEGRRAGEGYYNSDGTLMVFQSERDATNPFYQIYLMDLENGDVERISPGTGKTTCAWVHPDRRRVLFASTHADPRARQKQEEELAMRASGKERRYAWDYDEYYELFEYDRTTRAYKNLSRVRGYDAEGSYSPDGTMVAFASNRHAYTEPLSDEVVKKFELDKSLLMDIYIMKADGTEVRRLTTTLGYDGGPFFSADGKRICWRRFSEDGARAEVFTMNLDGTDQRPLTRIGAMSWAPYFHPTGEYLIFTTNRHGFDNFELYIVDHLGRGEPIRVTDSPGFDGLPTFTPDGANIAWTSNRTSQKQSQIFIGKWSHALAMQLIAKQRSTARSTSRRAPTSRATGVATFVATEPTTAAIRAIDMKRHTYALSAPKMAGRMTGSDGERRATQYAADWFAKVGLEPAGDDGGWFQEFAFSSRLDRDKPAIKGTGRNVLGVLRAKNRKDDGIIVVGAHIDHLGLHGGSSSLAANDDKDSLHPGADDNASGVAALIEIAEYLKAQEADGRLGLTRDVVFAGWSGEELGLFGSKHFVKKLAGDSESIRDKVVANFNMDMIGRLDRKLIVSGVGSSSIWAREVERCNAPVGLPVALVQDCYLATDTTSFYLKGVPILNVFTGAHSDYHRPSDTPDKVNYQGMQRIGRFVALLVRSVGRMTSAPDYVLQERQARATPRAGSRPYLGTIPDYAEAPIPGLMLSGVTAGAPAAKAGVKGGDIIVELAGVKVKNINDYAAAIDKLEIGKGAKVVVVRKDKKLEFTVVPAARD